MLTHRCDPNTSDLYLCSDKSREMSTSTFCNENIAVMVQKPAIEKTVKAGYIRVPEARAAAGHRYMITLKRYPARRLLQ